MYQTNLAIWLPSNYNFDPNSPTIRLRRLNLRKPLRRLGVRADIIYRYTDLWKFDHIMVTHFDKEIVEHCKILRMEGKMLYFDHSEHLTGLPYQDDVFNLCDYIVCCSKKLAELTEANLKSNFTKCVVIEDMAEDSGFDRNKSQIEEIESKYTKVVGWTGMGGNSWHAKELKPIIEELGMELVIISEHAEADIMWRRDTYLKEMSNFDIIICPQNVKTQPAKSCVKVITAMSLGKPIICSPLPAYLEVIKEGENGLIANNLQEWKEKLTLLRDDKILRNKLSKAASITSKAFSPLAIAKKWKLLLEKKRPQIAFINNTLPHKYLSYGDEILEQIRYKGYYVEEFRYEDIDMLPNDFSLYIFIEVRYNPEEISFVVHHPLRGQLPSDGGPRILVTMEDIDINYFAHFDLVVTANRELGEKWINRGFVNVEIIENWNDIDPKYFTSLVNEENFLAARQKHNFDLHSQHIDAFHHLQPPEERWEGGSRDQLHIKWTMEQTHDGSSILDIGSADGWLACYLAIQNRNISALEFVERGIAWTNQNARRLDVQIDLRHGFIEKVDEIFSDKKFDYILAYEILEHLDYRRVPWYLNKLEKLLNPGGRILITLPKQDLRDNREHLWSPNINLIDKLFKNKYNYQCQWIDIPNHGVAGNWFISYKCTW